MNMKTLKGVVMVAWLLVGMVGCDHTRGGIATTGKQSLGLEETATANFTFTCPEGTVSAQANVEDLTNAIDISGLMRVMLIAGNSAVQAEDSPPPMDDQYSGEGGEPSLQGGSAAQAKDSNPRTHVRPSGKADGPSQNAVLQKGPGPYLVIFFKTDEGQKAYVGSAVCQTASGPVAGILRKIENE